MGGGLLGTGGACTARRVALGRSACGAPAAPPAACSRSGRRLRPAGPARGARTRAAAEGLAEKLRAKPPRHAPRAPLHRLGTRAWHFASPRRRPVVPPPRALGAAAAGAPSATSSATTCAPEGGGSSAPTPPSSHVIAAPSCAAGASAQPETPLRGKQPADRARTGRNRCSLPATLIAAQSAKQSYHAPWRRRPTPALSAARSGRP